MRSHLLLTAACLVANANPVDKRATSVPAYFRSGEPQYFQTTPELFAGPTPTGAPAFLAETNPAPFHGITYIPPQPLETQVPIQGAPPDGNIYQLHGQLSHYFPNPVGLGVDEYPLPAGCHITMLHMLSRHGSRYPTATLAVVSKIQNNTRKATFKGQLAFLNTWTYKLGRHILTPVGKQELFDSGSLHQYQYGHLYPNNGTKIIARTTTQDRMIQSAEYFLAGFFGLHWPDNATLEVIIEGNGFNNSLAGYDNCRNSNHYRSHGGFNLTNQWAGTYLADATKRIQAMTTPSNLFTVTDVHNMQSLCAYETVALGYSAFCDLFTYEEWEGYQYSVDLSFYGSNSFGSPTGRAVGIGYVQEIRARLMHHYITKADPATQVNVTLDSMASTFPLNQSLYFDFSHDTNIMSILTAFGLTQFQQNLPATVMMPDRQLIGSHLVPFGARLDIEIIQSPGIVPANRASGPVPGTPPTSYIHFILNQRTLPLGLSFAHCGRRSDGWCELGAFLDATADAYELSQYDHACNGEYPAHPPGVIFNGAPLYTKLLVQSGGGAA